MRRFSLFLAFLALLVCSCCAEKRVQKRQRDWQPENAIYAEAPVEVSCLYAPTEADVPDGFAWLAGRTLDGRDVTYLVQKTPLLRRGDFRACYAVWNPEVQFGVLFCISEKAQDRLQGVNSRTVPGMVVHVDGKILLNVAVHEQLGDSPCLLVSGNISESEARQICELSQALVKEK